MSEREDDLGEFGPQPTFGASLHLSHTNQGIAGEVWRGRPRKFPTPDDLLKGCLEYIEWCNAHPLLETVLASGAKGDGQYKTTMPRMRAMSINGLCLFLEIDENNWRDYAAGRRGEAEGLADDFRLVCTRVSGLIRDQKFTGAAGGFLNPSIIARDLGLADKREITGANGGPVEIDNTMSPKEAADAYQAQLKDEGQ